ncbi:hypothetical protein JVU11DRAFT_12619 [Chiua virens]|nr:hypothetical protein JVU11DRAFT_12619 [Chiua virens]
MSSRNPFRSHPPSNKPEVVVRPPSPPLPPLPSESRSFSPPPDPPPRPEIPSSSSRTTPADTAPPPIVTDDIDDDVPPPYTPSANASVGEETLGIGPPRPFQQGPPLPSSSLYSNPPPPVSQPVQPSFTGSGHNYHYPQASRPGLVPWQSQQQYRQRQNVGRGGLFGALFDTVREIADVVSGAHEERMIAQRANAGAYTAPYSGTSTNTMYALPPGPPGPPPPRPASTPPHSSPPMVPDDGSPTRRPVPGHPLLRGGNLLVYPRDHLCVKCKNTGYKNYDPSHPCRKCWEKYGKPYSGALAYTNWSPSGNDPRMQRPLPRFVPPQYSGLNAGSPSSSAYAPQQSSSLFPPPPQHPHHHRSVSQPHSIRAPSGASYYVRNPLSPYGIPPVPEAIAVSPGDPRLGGRLCVRCGGSGVQTFMLIDVTTCDNCGGTGRVWM